MFPIITADQEEPESLPYFVVGNNGIFLRKQSLLGVSTSQVKGIAHLPKIEEDLEYTLPVIPAAISAQIGGFLRLAHKRFHTEAAVLLCLDEKKQWQIVIPRQKAKNVDVEYFIDEDTIPTGWKLMGTVHSHPFGSYKPVASSTDVEDEKKIDGVHLISSSPNDNPIQYSAAVSVDGVRWLYNDWRTIMESAAPVDVPEEWLDNIERSLVDKAVGKVQSWYGGGAYSGGSYYGGGVYSGGSYKEKAVPKEGETIEDAFRRVRKYSIDFCEETALASGYEFHWTLTPLQEAQGSGAGQAPTTALAPVAEHSNDATVSNPKLPDNWQAADLIRCKGKHPAIAKCRKNCGCHCQPCKDGLVGSYDATIFDDGAFYDDAAEVNVCACEECFNGCDATVFRADEEICSLCKQGDHWADIGGMAEKRLTAGRKEVN